MMGPGPMMHGFCGFGGSAPANGKVAAIDCLEFNRLARTAGAPIDKGAGIKLFKKIGDRVEQGEPLYRVYACDAGCCQSW